MTWLTMFQKPAEGEVVLIAIPPDIITMAVYDGQQFVNYNGKVKASVDDVAYWSPITNPWQDQKNVYRKER